MLSTTTTQNKYKHARNEGPFAGAVHNTCPTVHGCFTCNESSNSLDEQNVANGMFLPYRICIFIRFTCPTDSAQLEEDQGPCGQASSPRTGFSLVLAPLKVILTKTVWLQSSLNNTLGKKYVHKAKQNMATTSNKRFCIWSLSVKCISVDLSRGMIVTMKIYPSALENSPLLLNRVFPNGEFSGRPCLTGEGVYAACILSTGAHGSPVAQSGHGSS